MNKKNARQPPQIKQPESSKTEVLESGSADLSNPEHSPPQNEEQKLYWEDERFYKKWGFRLSVLGFILLLVGVGFNSCQTYLNRKQVELNTEQLKLSAEQSVKLEKSVRANLQSAALNHLLIVDQIFIQKPYLKPYFYDGKPIDEKDEKFQEVNATAEMILDVFELYADRTSYDWNSPEQWEAWMTDVFFYKPNPSENL